MSTLTHKVIYREHGKDHDTFMSLASAKTAVTIAATHVKDRLWSNVRFEELVDGKWIADTGSQESLMSKVSSVAKKETSMSAVPALIQLGELVGTLEKQAAKNLLTADQKQELVDYTLSAFVAVGISNGAVIAALTKAYPQTVNNDATEKVAAISPLPQIPATPRETPPQEKPQEKLHVQVPDKEVKRGGLFNR